MRCRERQGFTAGALSYASAIAVDQLGNDLYGGGLDIPSSLAVDASANIWVANQGASPLTQMQPPALQQHHRRPISSPAALAIDSK